MHITYYLGRPASDWRAVLPQRNRIVAIIEMRHGVGETPPAHDDSAHPSPQRIEHVRRVTESGIPVRRP
jgi:hypothetical protein